MVKMHKEIWVFAEACNNSIERVSLELLGEVRRLSKNGAPTAAVLIGAGISPSLRQTLSQYGAQKIYIVDHEKLLYYQSEIYTHILTQLVRQKKPQIILLGATPNGNDMASRVAARLRVGFVSNCTDLKLNDEGRLVLWKAIRGGKSQAAFMTVGSPQIATVCPDVIGLEKVVPLQTVPVEHLDISWDKNMEKAEVIEFFKGNPATIDITEAEIIVAGGRGVGGVEKWPLIEGLADVIGGAVAGSRMAKDLGCISRDRLVGQTGKNVRPKLYMALGISGASHHVNGLKEAEKVVVINKDRHAPFIKKADLAVIADLQELLPVFKETVTEYFTGGHFSK